MGDCDVAMLSAPGFSVPYLYPSCHGKSGPERELISRDPAPHPGWFNSVFLIIQLSYLAFWMHCCCFAAVPWVPPGVCVWSPYSLWPCSCYIWPCGENVRVNGVNVGHQDREKETERDSEIERETETQKENFFTPLGL